MTTEKKEKSGTTAEMSGDADKEDNDNDDDRADNDNEPTTTTKKKSPAVTASSSSSSSAFKPDALLIFDDASCVSTTTSGHDDADVNDVSGVGLSPAKLKEEQASRLRFIKTVYQAEAHHRKISCLVIDQVHR